MPVPPGSATSRASIGTVDDSMENAIKALPDLDSMSLSSEWDCAICYQSFTEPVLAGCGRHTFCRNCLLQSQRVGRSSRCPVCRVPSRDNALDLPELTELVERIRRRDPHYDERLALARQEREELALVTSIRTKPLVAANLTSDAMPVTIEVCGAGSSQVNGTYVAAVLPTYSGPTAYRKEGSCLFIYRWQRTQWVICDVRVPYSMGNKRDWLYHVSTIEPVDLPPSSGWEVPMRGRATRPCPVLQLIRDRRAQTPTLLSAHQVSRSERPSPTVLPRNIETVDAPQENFTRCGPTCALM